MSNRLRRPAKAKRPEFIGAFLFVDAMLIQGAVGATSLRDLLALCMDFSLAPLRIGRLQSRNQLGASALT